MHWISTGAPIDLAAGSVRDVAAEASFWLSVAIKVHALGP